MNSHVDTASDVTVSNAEMVDSWNGADGDNWADHVENDDRAVRQHHQLLFATAGFCATDVVLDDLGCVGART